MAFALAYHIYDVRITNRDEIIKNKDDTIRRYSDALEIGEPSKRTALTVLTNDELRKKALNLSKKLRDGRGSCT